MKRGRKPFLVAMVKTCPVCRNDYTTYRENQKFCSTSCAIWSRHRNKHYSDDGFLVNGD